MKTKTILLAGLIGAASALSSMAQVYSVNVVGFVNLTIPPGFSMISNPLNGTANTIGALLTGSGATVPSGTHVFKFDPNTSTFENNRFLSSSGWADPNMTMNPGEGVFIQNNSGASFTITFVGTVQTGALSLSMSAGYNIVSIQTPTGGLLDDTTANGLNFPLANGDHFFFYNNANTSYDTYRFLGSTWQGPNGSGGIGSSAAPQVAVGQAFWVQKAVLTSWNRTFTTN